MTTSFQSEKIMPPTHTKMPLPSFYKFWKILFMGTIGFNVMVLSACQWVYPQHVIALGEGMGLGLVYLLTLKTSSNQPVPKIQFALSVVRMMVFAGLIVWLGNFNLLRTLVVILGCFSYKGFIFFVAIRHMVQNECIKENK